MRRSGERSTGHTGGATMRRADRSGTATRRGPSPAAGARPPARPGAGRRRPDAGRRGPRTTRALLQILSTEHWSLLAAPLPGLQRGLHPGGHVPHRAVRVHGRHRLRRPGRPGGERLPDRSPSILLGVRPVRRADDLPAAWSRPPARISAAVAGHEPDPSRLPRDGARARALLRVQRPRRPGRHPDDLRGTVTATRHDRPAGRAVSGMRPRLQHATRA